MTPLEALMLKVTQLLGGATLLFASPVSRMASLRVLHNLKDKHFAVLNVILQTHGGDGDAAYNIAKMLQMHADHVNIIVPLFAKSAGTMICLAANDLLMTELSELGPLDAQIQERRSGDSPEMKSALNGFRALERLQVEAYENLDLAIKLLTQKTGLKASEAISLAIEFSGKLAAYQYAKIDPKEIGEYDRILQVGQRYGCKILTKYMGWSEEKASQMIRKLVEDYPSHGFIIDLEELVNLGLPAKYVDETQSESILELGEFLLNLEDPQIMLLEKT